MKLSLGSFLFIFLTIFSNYSSAQTPDVKFTLVTGGNGISFGKINAIIKDKYGFLWLSDQSNGCIIRYDGNQIIRYKSLSKNPNSLGGAYPECLATDSAGILWIGFYGMGLDRFDPFTNTFTHFRHSPGDPQSLASDAVSAVLVDHLGNVWVGNDGGLDLLDQKTGKFQHYSNKPGDTTSLSNDAVRVIYEDKAGELWIGTGYPWYGYKDDKAGGLNHFHRNNGTFTRYMNDPGNPATLIDNKVRAIFEDSRGTFWIGTRGDGLHTLDRKTGLVTRYTNYPEKPGQLSRPAVKGGDDHITFITEDIAHQLWVGTLANGIIRYDPETKKVVHYTNYNATVAEKKDTSGWCALATQDGIVWLSTQNANLYKIDLYNSIAPQFGESASDGVHTICAESDSVLWWGTSSGLVRKDIKNEITQHFMHDPNNQNSLSSNKINEVIRDKRGDLWIGTSGGGLNQYNPVSKTFVHYLSTDVNKSENQITVLCEDYDSTIWIGTTGAGIYHLDPATGKTMHYEVNRDDPTSIFSNAVSTILPGDSNDLWVGASSANGISRMDRRTKSFRFYLSGVRIYCTYKDKSGTIWVGSEGGLFRYNKESDTFLAGAEINDALNLPNAFSIIEDNENNLWVVSTPGIYKLNPRRDFANLFGPEHGFTQGNDFFNRAVVKMQSGELYFGHSTGYYAFYPDKMGVKPNTAQLYLTNLWLNNTEVISGIPGPLPNLIFATNEIRLKYNQNIFSFAFSVIDFRESNLRVYYKLENYDPDWRAIGASSRAEYYKVPPGKYRLLFKTVNSSNGEWIEKSVVVIISPPWWKTWWAYCLYGLFIMGSGLMIHRYQKERLISKEREKARVNELKQAKEIEKAYQDLKLTQAQLIQSEKMASLGELTAGIAHEIQNPLNFINNFSEVNAELIDEMQQELNSGNISEAIAISNGLKENQGKITQHGKRADGIVKGMLQHSRNSSGQKEWTDLNSLADEYLRLSYHGFRAKENQFNSAIDTDFDPATGNINIIPQDIGRVLMNLYNNAFYAVSEKKKGASEDYHPAVSVTTQRSGEKIEITVKDNGNGIPAKVKDKIFQPFFTTKPAGQGTGLGLSMSYDIIKAHGGHLKVETKEGSGSEFVIELPVK